MERGPLSILQVACLHLVQEVGTVRSVPFFLASERSGWNRPLEALCSTYEEESATVVEIDTSMPCCR